MLTRNAKIALIALRPKFLRQIAKSVMPTYAYFPFRPIRCLEQFGDLARRGALAAPNPGIWRGESTSHRQIAKNVTHLFLVRGTPPCIVNFGEK